MTRALKKLMLAAAIAIASGLMLFTGDVTNAVAADPAANPGEKKFTDGRWRFDDGTPTYKMGEKGEVDWASWQGFRRYHDACHVCHGPNAAGSTFAPSLADSLKTMDYPTFMQIVSSGKETNRAGTEYVMPAFGSNRDVMCYIDDIYTYIKGRSDEAIAPGRPPGRADISEEASKAAKECLGD